jgi:hypothetical protein
MTRGARILVLTVVLGCNGATSHGPAVQVLTDPQVATADNYFGSVWPDDRRLDVNGYFAGNEFPNPRPGALFDSALAGSGGLVKGWGVASPIYVPMSGAISAASLPADAAASMKPDASVFLTAIDPVSPVYGQPVPLEWKIIDAPTLWLPGHILAVRPFVGFPLKAKTRYALVVTTRVKSASGDPVAAGPGFVAGLTSANSEEKGNFFKPLAAFLDAQHIGHDTVAGAAVFTTQATMDELLKLRDWMEKQPRATLSDTVKGRMEGSYDVLDTTYGPAPWLLNGQPPYSLTGGDIRYDANGDPIPALQETMRVTICLPHGTPPANGFPVVFVSHGTGGDYTSFVQDGTCALLAVQGIASFGIDQVVSGARTPPNSTCLGQAPDNCFLNVVNPVAARNLVRHSALDHITLRRMVEGLTIDAGHDPEGRPGGVHFDLTHFAFFGHSQGGLTGGLYAAIEKNLSGALLSGAGGHVTTTLLVRDSGAIKDLLESGLFFNIAGTESLDQFHPALAFLQTMADVTDPLSYGEHWIKDPQGRPKNIFMTSGLNDPYTPTTTASALAITAGLPQLTNDHTDDPGFDLAGLMPVPAPLQGNIMTTGSVASVTAVFRQFPGAGHFVVFDDKTAKKEEGQFFRTLVTTGTAQFPPP